jgi:DNA-binding NtrC family response regulator
MGQSSHSKSATVLIVQREGVVALELAARLADMGLTVLQAADADEAVALLDDHSEIKLLVTDVRMAGSVDGIRLAHHVRERWPPVKIIITSGMMGTAASDLPPGTIILPKPYGPEAVANAVSYAMGRSRPSPSYHKRQASGS